MIPPAEDAPSRTTDSRYYDDSYELREIRILIKNTEFVISNLDDYRGRQAYGPGGELRTDEERDEQLDRDHKEMRDRLRDTLKFLNKWRGQSPRSW